MLWFINNIKDLKAENEELTSQLTQLSEACAVLQANYAALEARVTALDGGPPPPPPTTP